LLGWHVREAAEHDPRVAELTQRVREATAALAGLEVDTLRPALRVQEHALSALIRQTTAHHRAAEAGDAAV
jgi:hypothetical protein